MKAQGIQQPQLMLAQPSSLPTLPLGGVVEHIGGDGGDEDEERASIVLDDLDDLDDTDLHIDGI